MFGHRSFLMLGGDSLADIRSLTERGYEILDCCFGFHRNIDRKGKATTKVYGGIFNVNFSQLPSNELIEWGMKSRKYLDGVIVVLDADNVPLEKFIFKNAACVKFGINYTLSGDSYPCTKMLIHAEKVTVGNGIEFSNEWTYD